MPRATVSHRELTGSTNAYIRIVMDRRFEEFGPAEKARFLKELADISGCPVSDFTAVRFLKGCVIFEGEFDREAIARLIEYFRNVKLGKHTPELELFAQFVANNNITVVDSEFTVQVHVIKRERQQPSRDREIIFVHGWSGDKDSFGKLPSYISAKYGCNCPIYRYPTDWFTHSPSVLLIARNLDNWIRNNANAKELAIIAHSFGGLIARQFLVTQKSRDIPLDRKVKLVTFIASPHDGTQFANLAKEIPFLRSDQLRELSPNSPVLLALNEEWSRWVRSHVPHRCLQRTILGTADSVVSLASAQGSDPETTVLLGFGHKDIVRPEAEDAEIVQTIDRFLREAGFPYLAEQDSSMHVSGRS
jgi:pimeloyl-ACP methyl ester carboxylesterase